MADDAHVLGEASAAPAGTDEGVSARGARTSRGRHVQLALTLLAIGAVAWVVDWGRFVDLVRTAQPSLLGLAAALFAADRLLMSYKWRLLLTAQGARVPLWECWGLYSLATLSGIIMPATIGGDVLRSAWLWRRGVPGSKSIASIALERLIGAVVALSAAAAALAYLSAELAGRAELRTSLGVVLAALALLVGGLLLSFWRGVLRPLAWLRGRLGRKVAAWLAAVHASYVAYLSSPGVVAAFALLTVVEYLLILVASYVVALALRIAVGPVDFAAALSLAMLLARLPIAIDGLGVFEGSLIGLLVLAGVPPAGSLALAVASRLLNLLICAPPAALLLAVTPVGLQEIRRLRNR
jgi:glycosyltransferase 2 family protein